MNIREKILAANDRKFEIVDCPEWDCSVHVYSMTTRDRSKLEIACAKGVPEDFYARVAYLCICDEGGVRLFSEKDIEELQEKSPVVITRISQVGLRLSKMDEAPQDIAEKNSETTPDGSADAV